MQTNDYRETKKIDFRNTIVVEDDQKAPFSIVFIGVEEDATLFPGLLHFTFDTYLILLSVKQRSIQYYFKDFGMMRLGIVPTSPGPLASSLPTWPILAFTKKIRF